MIGFGPLILKGKKEELMRHLWVYSNMENDALGEKLIHNF